jgi:4-hydroxybenzoate polyprenyltransferase
LFTKIKKIVNTLDQFNRKSSSKNNSVVSYFKILRPHQWLKNLLVFLPILASHQFNQEVFLQSFLAFIAFSLIASSAYVINDLLDIESDRKHPRKKYRPFASGELSTIHVFWLAPLLLFLGLLVGFLVEINLTLLLFFYFILTILYSTFFKQLAIIDISILAGLYTLRILAGSVASSIPPSVLLLAFSIFVFFSLAAFKRQTELNDYISRGESSLFGRGYNSKDITLISQMALVSGYISALVLALYVDSIMAQELYQSPALLWGVCLVFFYWINRVAYVTFSGEMPDDPLIFLVKDNQSKVCLLVGLLFVLSATLT